MRRLLLGLELLVCGCVDLCLCGALHRSLDAHHLLSEQLALQRLQLRCAAGALVRNVLLDASGATAEALAAVVALQIGIGLVGR